MNVTKHIYLSICKRAGCNIDVDYDFCKNTTQWNPNLTKPETIDSVSNGLNFQCGLIIYSIMLALYKW